MLQNAYLLAKIGADTAENERNFAQNLQKKRVDELLVGREAEGGGQHRLPGGEAVEALAVLAQLRAGVELHLDQGVDCGVNSTAGRAENF